MSEKVWGFVDDCMLPLTVLTVLGAGAFALSSLTAGEWRPDVCHALVVIGYLWLVVVAIWAIRLRLIVMDLSKERET
jgi:hypothetical protein